MDANCNKSYKDLPGAPRAYQGWVGESHQVGREVFSEEVTLERLICREGEQSGHCWHRDMKALWQREHSERGGGRVGLAGGRD